MIGTDILPPLVDIYTMTIQKLANSVTYLDKQMHIDIVHSYFSLLKTSDKLSGQTGEELSLPWQIVGSPKAV